MKYNKKQNRGMKMKLSAPNTLSHDLFVLQVLTEKINL